jgi:hypothetical protein
MAWHRVMLRRPVSREDWQFLLGEAMPRPGLAGLLWRLRIRLFGTPPAVTRLHPRWPDFGLPYAALREIMAGGVPTLMVAARPAMFAEWLTHTAGEIYTLESSHLLAAPPSLYEPLMERFGACLMIVTEDLLAKADQLIARAGPLLNQHGRILMMLTNDRGYAKAHEFKLHFTQQSARLLDLSAWITEIHYVPASGLRWAVYRAMWRVVRRGDAIGWRSPVRLALMGFVSLPLMLAALVINLGIRAQSTPPRGLWSSVFLVLRPSNKRQVLPLPSFESRCHTADKREGATPHG